MTEQSNTFDSQNGTAPRHGRHVSSSQSDSFDDVTPNGVELSSQEVAAHSRHAAIPSNEALAFEEEPPSFAADQAFAEEAHWGSGSDFGEVVEESGLPAGASASGQSHYEHDLSGLSEYAYGAPVVQPASSSYAYGVSNASDDQFDEVESVLPDKLRSKNGGAPRKLLKTIGKIILLLFLFGMALGLGVVVGLVNLMDVNPLVLFALS